MSTLTDCQTDRQVQNKRDGDRDGRVREGG